LPLTQTRKLLPLALATATLLLTFTVINNGASAQTFNPQQPPFDGTMPSPGFNGGMGPGGFNGTFPDGGMGDPGGFNGTMPGGPDDGNFTRPDFMGTPPDGIYNENNGLVSGSQPDYTLIIIIAVVAVVAAVAVIGAVLFRKRKSQTCLSTSPTDNTANSNFDFQF
jgi:hypothetical protein